MVETLYCNGVPYQKTTSVCPVCGEEKHHVGQTYRDHSSGRILRNRWCTRCRTEWSSGEGLDRILRVDVGYLNSIGICVASTK